MKQCDKCKKIYEDNCSFKFCPDCGGQINEEIMCMKKYYEQMNDFLKGIFFGAIALTARGCNDYMWTSSTVGKNIEPKRYIDFFEKMVSKTKNIPNILTM